MAFFLPFQTQLAGVSDPFPDQNPSDPNEFLQSAVTVNYFQTHVIDSERARDIADEQIHSNIVAGEYITLDSDGLGKLRINGSDSDLKVLADMAADARIYMRVKAGKYIVVDSDGSQNVVAVRGDSDALVALIKSVSRPLNVSYNTNITVEGNWGAGVSAIVIRSTAMPMVSATNAWNIDGDDYYFTSVTATGLQDVWQVGISPNTQRALVGGEGVYRSVAVNVNSLAFDSEQFTLTRVGNAVVIRSTGTGMDSRLDSEIEARIAADSDLQAQINAEMVARILADSELFARLDSETRTRIMFDSDFKFIPSAALDSDAWATYITRYATQSSAVIGEGDPSGEVTLPGQFYIDTQAQATGGTYRLWYRDPTAPTNNPYYPVGNVTAQPVDNYLLVANGLPAGIRVTAINGPEAGFVSGSITITGLSPFTLSLRVDSDTQPVNSGVSRITNDFGAVQQGHIGYITNIVPSPISGGLPISSTTWKIGVSSVRRAESTAATTATQWWTGSGTAANPEFRTVYQLAPSNSSTIDVSLGEGRGTQSIVSVASAETWEPLTYTAGPTTGDRTTLPWMTRPNIGGSFAQLTLTYINSADSDVSQLQYVLFTGSGTQDGYAYDSDDYPDFRALQAAGIPLAIRPNATDSEMFEIVEVVTQTGVTNISNISATRTIRVKGDLRPYFSSTFASTYNNIAYGQFYTRRQDAVSTLFVSGVQAATYSDLQTLTNNTNTSISVLQNSVTSQQLASLADVGATDSLSINNTSVPLNNDYNNVYFAPNPTAALSDAIAFINYNPGTQVVSGTINTAFNPLSINTAAEGLLRYINTAGHDANVLLGGSSTLGASTPAWAINLTAPIAYALDVTGSLMSGTFSGRLLSGSSFFTENGTIQPNGSYTITVDSDAYSANPLRTTFVNTIGDNTVPSWNYLTRRWEFVTNHPDSTDSAATATIEFTTVPTTMTGLGVRNTKIVQPFAGNYNSGSTGAYYSYYFPRHYKYKNLQVAPFNEILYRPGKQVTVFVPPNSNASAARTTLVNALNLQGDSDFTVADSDGRLWFNFIETPGNEGVGRLTGYSGTRGLAVAVTYSPSSTGVAFDSEGTELAAYTGNSPIPQPTNLIRFIDPMPTGNSAVQYISVAPQFTYSATSAIAQAYNALNAANVIVQPDYNISFSSNTIRFTSKLGMFVGAGDLMEGHSHTISLVSNVLSYGQDPTPGIDRYDAIAVADERISERIIGTDAQNSLFAFASGGTSVFSYNSWNGTSPSEAVWICAFNDGTFEQGLTNRGITWDESGYLTTATPWFVTRSNAYTPGTTPSPILSSDWGYGQVERITWINGVGPGTGYPRLHVPANTIVRGTMGSLLDAALTWDSTGPDAGFHNDVWLTNTASYSFDSDFKALLDSEIRRVAGTAVGANLDVVVDGTTPAGALVTRIDFNSSTSVRYRGSTDDTNQVTVALNWAPRVNTGYKVIGWSQVANTLTVTPISPRVAVSDYQPFEANQDVVLPNWGLVNGTAPYITNAATNAIANTVTLTFGVHPDFTTNVDSDADVLIAHQDAAFDAPLYADSDGDGHSTITVRVGDGLVLNSDGAIALDETVDNGILVGGSAEGITVVGDFAAGASVIRINGPQPVYSQTYTISYGPDNAYTFGTATSAGADLWDVQIDPPLRRNVVNGTDVFLYGGFIGTLIAGSGIKYTQPSLTWSEGVINNGLNFPSITVGLDYRTTPPSPIYVAVGTTTDATRKFNFYNSTDGVTWRQRASIGDQVTPYAVSWVSPNATTTPANYPSGIFIAFGDGSANANAYYSVDGGLSWSTLLFGGGTAIIRAAITPNNTNQPLDQTLIVGSAASNGYISRASNGWTGWSGNLNNAASTTFNGGAYAVMRDSAGVETRLYIVVGVDSSAGNAGVIYTADATNTNAWTRRGSYFSHPLNAAAWSGKRVVAVGNAGLIVTSTDGINWSANVVPGLTADLTSVLWTGNQFIAVGSNSTVLTSPDGATWMAQAQYTTGISYRSIVQYNRNLLAVGDFGRFITTGGLNYTNQGTTISVDTTVFSTWASYKELLTGDPVSLGNGFWTIDSTQYSGAIYSWPSAVTGTTIYRGVPSTYAYAGDAFFTNYNAGPPATLSGLIKTRAQG